MYQFAQYTSLFFRSTSSFMTLLIAVERYLVVAFPLRCSNWFTIRRSRFFILSVVIFSLMMAIPRYSSTYVTENLLCKFVPNMEHLEYIIVTTSLEWYTLWYKRLKGFFNVIDFLVPLPLLLLINALTYYEVHILHL